VVPFSLRTHILVLVLCTTLVPAAITAWIVAGDRDSDVAQAREKLLLASQRIAEELQDAVRSTAQLEYGLSRARDLDTGDRAACSAFLAGVLKEYPQYTGILTIRPDGHLFCDSLRTGRTLLLTDRHYFRQALEPRTSLALEPAFGRLTGKAVLQIAYPARDDGGALRFVLLASLDLDKFMRGRARGLPFESAALMLMDRNGTILTLHPEGEMRPGTSLADSPLHRLAQRRNGSDKNGEIELGGVSRVWAAVEPGPRGAPGADLSVLVGVSRSELTAAADRRLSQTLAVVFVVSLLAFGIVWALAEAGIRRPIQRMMEATARIGSGDLHARIGEPYARGELGALMRALDATAEQLDRLNTDLERRVAERTAQLEAANREIDSFSYSVSHDLRAPLRAIDGYAQILGEDYSDRLDDEGRRLLGVVRDRAQRMGDLIDELLLFSRLGRGPLATTRIDMDALVRGVVEELDAGGAGSRPRIEIGTLPAASGDSALVRQVWMNLISNAIKFSRKREDAQIAVSASNAHGEQVYCVRDNGAGFDMAYYDKLFGVFQRLHGPDEFPGTGVGLAIVQRVVARHGGRVWAESKVGEGAVFYFSLPKS
jgi:signal transduction histidine kinase